MGFQHYKKFLWCFIGFIVAMKLVKRILGNNNFDSLSSSSLTCFSGCRFSFSFSFTTWISEDEVEIDPLVNKLEYTNNKRPSKPSLSSVLEPSKLLLPTDFLKSCFH